MRDKDARKRILLCENKLERIESILKELSYTIQAAFSTPEITATCTVCQYYLNGRICDNSDCPHGLDE